MSGFQRIVHQNRTLMRRGSAIVGAASLAIALPAAVFAEPVIMGLAAGAASLAALARVSVANDAQRERDAYYARLPSGGFRH